MKASSHIMVIALTSIIQLSGCGGGSSPAPTPTPTPLPPQPKTTNVSVTGNIIGLGGNKLQIKAESYDVSSSSITLDGVSSIAADLRQGMIVTLKGTSTTTTAKTNKAMTNNSIFISYSKKT